MNNQNKKLDEINMDYQTYKKISGTLNPKDKKEVTITSPNPNQLSTADTVAASKSMASAMEEQEVAIQPQDQATIKYLSNVKDSESGEVSKPFTIGDKRYQMVRGTTPSKEIVMGVYCHDDLNENGENIIHPVDHFEENIAKPMKERLEMQGQDIGVELAPKVKEGGYDHAAAEREHHDKESFMDYLNLTDIEPNAKHFFVNIKTGAVTAQFKSTKEMAKSGVKLGPDEDYMDIKGLKRFRFGDYFKPNLNEDDLTPADAGTNIPKLQSDVKKLANMIKNKFSIYLSKLDKPIEQAQFLTAMASEIGVPLNKLSTIIASYKDIAKDGQLDTQNAPGMRAESKVITKSELEESLIPKKVIKIVKVKDIK